MILVNGTLLPKLGCKLPKHEIKFMTSTSKRAEIPFVKRNVVRKFKLIWLSSLQNIHLSVIMSGFVTIRKRDPKN